MNHLKQILILALFFTALIGQLYESDDSSLRDDILIAIGEINV